MEAFMDDKNIDPDLLKKLELKYLQEEDKGNVSPETKFEYAWGLVRSPYSDDWHSGLKNLSELFDKGDDHAKRDYLFYMAVGMSRLQQYGGALKYCENILKFQPGNHQVLELKRHIQIQILEKGFAAFNDVVNDCVDSGPVHMAIIGSAYVSGGSALADAAKMMILQKKEEEEENVFTI